MLRKKKRSADDSTMSSIAHVTRMWIDCIFQAPELIPSGLCKPPFLAALSLG
jgi:hypothetical protein